MSELIFILTKHLHVWCVTISFAFFLLRAVWHIKSSELLKQKWVKVAPHINDTILLISGAILIYPSINQSTVATWLFIKITLIVGYILTGIFAFRAKSIQKPLFVLAIFFFASVVYLAVTKPVF
jgi:uncharacterized membrane protein SirB2